MSPMPDLADRIQGLPTPPDTHRPLRATLYGLSRRDSDSVRLLRTRSYPMNVNSSEERFVIHINDSFPLPLPQWMLDEPLRWTNPEEETMAQTAMQTFSQQNCPTPPTNQVFDPRWRAFSPDTSTLDMAPDAGVESSNVHDTYSPMLPTPGNTGALDSLTPSPMDPWMPFEGGKPLRASAGLDQLELIGPLPGTSAVSTSPVQLRRALERPKPKQCLTESAQLALSNRIRDSSLSGPRHRIHKSTDSTIPSQSTVRTRNRGSPALARFRTQHRSSELNLKVSGDPAEWSRIASGLRSMSGSSILGEEVQTISPVQCTDETIDPSLLRQFASRSSSTMPSPERRTISQMSSRRQSANFTMNQAFSERVIHRSGEKYVDLAMHSAMLMFSPLQPGRIDRIRPAPLLGTEPESTGQNIDPTIKPALLNQPIFEPVHIPSVSVLIMGAQRSQTVQAASIAPVPIMRSQTPQTLQAASTLLTAGSSLKQREFDLPEVFAEVAAKWARLNK